MNHSIPALSLLCLACLGGTPASAQAPAPNSRDLPGLGAVMAAATEPRLREAMLLEEQAGDLKRAEAIYREVAADAATSEGVRDVARLRLGALQHRLGRAEEARATLQPLVAAKGPFAERASALLAGTTQDPVPAPSTMAQSLVDRATAVLRTQNGPPDSLREDILWLGAEGPPAIVAALRAQRDKSTTTYAWLADLLLALGNAPAVEYLQEVAREVDPKGRMAVLMASRGEFAPDVLPVLVQFALAPDPEGAVAKRLLQLGVSRRFTEDQFLLLAAATDAPPRLVAQEWLRAQGATAFADAPAGSAARFDFLRRSLDDSNPAVARAAHRVLQMAASQSRAGLLLALGRLGTGKVDLRGLPGIRLDDELLEAMLSVARNTGPMREQDVACESLASLLQEHPVAEDAFSTAGCSSLLALAELGYYRGDRASPGMPRGQIELHAGAFLRVCTPDQFVAAASTRMPVQFVQPLLAGAGSKPMRLPAADLRRMVESFRGAQLPAAWGQTSLFGADPQSGMVGWLAESLFKAVGAMGDASCVSWLRELAAAEPASVPYVLRALLALLEKQPEDAGIRDAVGALLGAPGTKWNQDYRAAVCRKLVDAGDLRGVEWLLARKGDEPQVVPSESALEPLLISLAALGTKATGPQPQLTRCWRDLLQQLPLPVLAILAKRSAGTLPVHALVPVLERAAGEGIPTAVADRVFRTVTDEMLETQEDLRAAMEQALARDHFLELVPRGRTVPQWMVRFLPVVRVHLARPESAATALWVMLQCDSVPTAAEWVGLLGMAEVRVDALGKLRGPLDRSVRDRLRALLADPDADVRTEAVQAVERCIDIPTMSGEGFLDAMLGLLVGQPDAVSKVTADVLQRLRTHQEQKAFWERFHKGVVLGPEATTARLVELAMTGDRSQRLLAITALGAAGATDALPYLVEWATRDPDEGLRKAAEEAIRQVGERTLRAGTGR